MTVFIPTLSKVYYCSDYLMLRFVNQGGDLKSRELCPGVVPMTWQGNFICKLILFSLSLIAVICRAIFGKTGWSEKAEILSKCCCSYLLIDRRMILIRSVPSLYYLAKFWCISPGCRRWCSRLSFLWPWTEHQKWTEEAFCDKIVFIFWFWFSISCKIGLFKTIVDLLFTGIFF